MRRVFAAFALVLFGQGVSAQSFPSKPIRLIAPFAAGGALDLIARGVGAKLAESMGQPVVVENRAGASGAIGSEAVARSAPDGYTLLLGATTTHGVNPALNPKLSYDPVRDFTPVSLVATIPHALVVNPSLPVNSVQDLVKYARSGHPLNYGSAGNGSPHHLAAELFKSMSGIQAVHVPYKGSGPALADLMSGQIQFISVELTAAEPYMKSGKLKALATATAERVPGMSLPTVGESGYPGFEVTSWYAIFGPAGMPAEVTGRLSAEIAKAVNETDLRDRLKGLGTTPIGSTPEALAAHVRAELERWTRVVKAAGIKPE
ncbi:MAG: tripartite tricarboxylate transporter substrate binding protein [Betaproteobacteria bacterium]|nr:MAG: tripartite tricarboxylate transporter substrate binding protein [Betaproteobacteria bacterium]TMI11439.1 MAG: tripartite tricarboxylate transporter substrate binding protein [Betaproteobacteria bacterium]